MGDIISSKVKDPYGEDGESERFFCLWSEIPVNGVVGFLDLGESTQAKRPELMMGKAIHGKY